MRLEATRRASSFGRRGGARALAGEDEEEHNVDLSGMSLESLDSLPRPSLNLATITKLDLSNNNLESIPESLTARLLNVVVLDVHSNQLQALPNSIGCLSKLKVLNVSGNMLESLPKTIEDCRALEELVANFNKLTTLPDTMGFELTNLQKLSVNSNKLDALPYSTSHMTSLRVLDARLNCLCSLPDGLENLSRLEVLNVSQNFRHLRSLPPAVGLLVSLLELDISYNAITALPDSLACLGKLRKLQAEGNPLACPPHGRRRPRRGRRPAVPHGPDKRHRPRRQEEVLVREAGEVLHLHGRHGQGQHSVRAGRGGWRPLPVALPFHRWPGVAQASRHVLSSPALLPPEFATEVYE